MFLASFAEIFSIGAVLPFLATIVDPTKVFDHPSAIPFIKFLGISNPRDLILPLSCAFGFAALTAGSMRLILLWASTRLSYAGGADISINIYWRTLHQPFSVHVNRNSSEMLDGISTKTNSAIYLINMTLNLISSSVMLIAILITLIAIDFSIAFILFGGFGLIYLVILWLTRGRLFENSKTIAKESVNVIKSLQEGLGGIRDILLDGSQSIYCQIYRNADQPLRLAQASNAFIGYGPRYGIEALGMILIASLTYFLSLKDKDLSNAIPILGSLALGAQRLLPLLQQIYGSYTGLKGGQESLKETLELLNQPMPTYIEYPLFQPLSFKKQIALKEISFRYSSETPLVLNGLNLIIEKGSCVGIMGTTGGGKSTLLDIIMGLLTPTSGSLEVDGQLLDDSNCHSWQKHIAHVPQSIYLADSTIEENIAFGVPKDQIDNELVHRAAQQAQISESIESWPKKYKTFVGERGIRLSGGQRQRIGIARALYKQADVIIFDEATSALDNETELSVMSAIENLSNDLTIIIIAHRLSTLKGCSQIFELANGNISRYGNYDKVIK